MKTTERHELKHNEVADTLQEAYARSIGIGRPSWLARSSWPSPWPAGAAIATSPPRSEAKAGALLAQALVVVEAPVAPPVAPARRPARAAMPAGTYPTEAAKLEAPCRSCSPPPTRIRRTQAGVSARYQAAAALDGAGQDLRGAAAGQRRSRGGGRGLYGRMARLGVAELDVKAGKFDPAIATLRELSLDAKGDLPVDAVLVRLAPTRTSLPARRPRRSRRCSA